MARLLVLFVAFFAASFSQAAEPTYWQDIRPVVRKHCTICHSEKNLKELDVSGGLALDSLEAIKKGGKKPVAKSGKASESEMIAILRHPKPARRMPLDADPLPDETVALLAKWIDAGMVEGTRPKDSEPVSPGVTPPRRRTEITLATKLPLPKSVAKPSQTAPLELVAPIGPLPPVAAVAFSGDGRFLASGAYGRVIVWDLKIAKPAVVLTNVLGAVNDLRFSPDSTLLVVAGGLPTARGDIRLFATADWKLSATLAGHSDVVGSVAFSLDGTLLASASFDKTVRVWNLAKRETIVNFTGHADFVHAVAFGPKGDWIVTASKDKTGRLIDVKTGESRLTFSGTDQEVLAVGVKLDGSLVATAGMDPSISWWNTQTGERTKRTNGHNVQVNEIVFSEIGDIAASAGSDKSVRLWNTKTVDALRTIPVTSIVYSVALSRNGKLVAAGCFDGLVRVFETDTARQLGTLVAVSESEWLAVTPEGFSTISDAMKKSARWQTGKVAMNLDWVWKALGQPHTVAKALAGEKMGEPAFSSPQP
ncbi:MAG: hypothetical protein EXS09_18950 [Gemmataceae bacterium]|nr:hypothetical protein [Gemmataceae bacterium]